MRGVFFTSDTHFGHKRVLQYSNRPFQTIEEHDEELIERWNKKVAPGSIVYHLGDFAFYRTQEQIETVLARLHGQKFLVTGNHDWEETKKAKGWVKVVPYHEIKILGNQKVVLFHYRMVVWNAKHYGSWALHGHSHGQLPIDYNHRTFDVGVDCWKYTPLEAAEVGMEMEKYTHVTFDRRGL